MNSLTVELEEAISEPDEILKDGHAPVPFFFAFEPAAENPIQQESFAALLGMSAVIRMFAGLDIISTRKARHQSTPYSITKPEEYVSAFAEKMDATVKALTQGPLTAFYQLDGGTTQSEHQSLTHADLHPFVLQRIFGGLSQVGEDAMKELDHQLTHFVALLNPFKVQPAADQPTLSHVILVNYVRVTDITGSGNALIIEPYTRMVNLSIKTADWSHALQKPGYFQRKQKINFSMTTTTTEFKLDKGRYQANKARYEQALQLMVSEDPDLKQIIDDGGIEEFGRKTCTVLPAYE